MRGEECQFEEKGWEKRQGEERDEQRFHGKGRVERRQRG
jgi:hypothetical protein